VHAIKKRFLAPRELAEYVGLSLKSIYRRFEPDHPEYLPSIRFGRTIRVDVEAPEFQAWISTTKHSWKPSSAEPVLGRCPAEAASRRRRFP
jgi:predicted DNA-binding transcriptional regulator AlpA